MIHSYEKNPIDKAMGNPYAEGMISLRITHG